MKLSCVATLISIGVGVLTHEVKFDVFNQAQKKKLNMMNKLIRKNLVKLLN